MKGWGDIVAPPSAKKSPAIAAAVKPLDRLIAVAMKTHRQEMEDHKTAQIVGLAEVGKVEVAVQCAAGPDAARFDLPVLAGGEIDEIRVFAIAEVQRDVLVE